MKLTTLILAVTLIATVAFAADLDTAVKIVETTSRTVNINTILGRIDTVKVNGEVVWPKPYDADTLLSAVIRERRDSVTIVKYVKQVLKAEQDVRDGEQIDMYMRMYGMPSWSEAGAGGNNDTLRQVPCPDSHRPKVKRPTPWGAR